MNKIYLVIPLYCPCCGWHTKQETLNSSTVLKCTNKNCTQQLIEKLSHFASRDAMNIDGLSSATIERFVTLGWLQSFEDIYNLKHYEFEMTQLDGFGKRSYENLIDAIEKSKNVKLENLLYALSIPNIGKNSSKIISKYFKGNYNELCDALISSFDFTALNDFGDTTNDSIYKWFDDAWDNSELLFIDKYLIFKQEIKKDLGFNSLKDLTFVVTGSIMTYKNRDELEALIVSLGGKTSGSVSKNTSFLINNDTTSTNGKNQKAKEVGVKIISEADFNKMIGRIV